MTRLGSAVRLVGTAAVVACAGVDESTGRPWDEPPPQVRVTIDAHAESLVVLDTVRSAPAPEVRFAALVEPDPSHLTALVSPSTGVFVRRLEQSRVRRGQTVAAVRPEGARDSAVSVVAPHDGIWRPRHGDGELVWRNDTLSALQESSRWWAVGNVSEVEGAAIHSSDAARVGRAGDHHRFRDARVERVVPGRPSPYSAVVAIHFRAPSSVVRQGMRVEVVVAPADPRDSLPAVPASALVRLDRGVAVGLPGAGCDRGSRARLLAPPAAREAGQVLRAAGVRALRSPSHRAGERGRATRVVRRPPAPLDS